MNKICKNKAVAFLKGRRGKHNLSLFKDTKQRICYLSGFPLEKVFRDTQLVTMDCYNPIKADI